jgi:ANTAR domain
VPRPDHDLSAVIRSLATVPVDRTTVSSVLAVLVDQAAPVLGAAPDASLTFVRRGAGRTLASTSDLALRLDEVQYRSDAGPCLDAATTGRPTQALAGDAARWPDVARALREVGIDSIWSHPLPLTGPATASLNLYVRDGGAADGEVAAALVEAAAVPVTNAWLYEESVRTIENLRVALDTRAVIEQAKGILMERLKVTAQQAFDALARTSNDTNTKLRDVAQAVVETGQIPR